MRLSEFYNLSKEEQKKEVEKAKVEIQEAYKELCVRGVFHARPKGFPKNDFTLWERQ